MDRSSLHAIASGYVSELADPVAHDLADRLEKAVTSLSESRSPASAEDPDAAIQRIEHAISALRRFTPLPLLGKVFSVALLEELERLGHPPLPTVQPSAGGRLAGDLVALARACRTAGSTPEEVASTWPDVPPPIADLVLRFAADHCGYGPLAWEAPGFTDPQVVVRALAMTGTNPPAATPEAEASHTSDEPALQQALTSWLRITEDGIKLIRETFYRAILPALGQAADDLGGEPTDLLFATGDEIAAKRIDASLIAKRRSAYFANADYLAKHHVDRRTLDNLMGAR